MPQTQYKTQYKRSQIRLKKTEDSKDQLIQIEAYKLDSVLGQNTNNELTKQLSQ